MSHDYLLQVRLWWPREGGPAPQWLPENIQRLFELGEGIEMGTKFKPPIPLPGDVVRIGSSSQDRMNEQRKIYSDLIPDIDKYLLGEVLEEVFVPIRYIETYEGEITPHAFLPVENAAEGERLLKALILRFGFDLEFWYP